MSHEPEGGHEQGWTEHEHAQLVRLSRLTLAEKLRWLEEAQRVVQAIEASRAGRPHGRDPEA